MATDPGHLAHPAPRPSLRQLPDRGDGHVGADSARAVVQLRAELSHMQAVNAELRLRLQDAEQRAAVGLTVRTELEQRLASVTGSKSWRLTAPLRRAVARARSGAR